jgi:hypothetical protein
MRLLRIDENSRFRLTKDLVNSIPPYAILSHTWGDDDEEVTFKDLASDSGMAKSGTAGYRKIQFCANQAARDKLQYFWVDSCCIDRSSIDELSTAINSMFCWYKNATKCYVYLSDVSVPQRDHSQPSGSSQRLIELSLSSSRWFTRGWTLQELLAPTSVEFFSQEGIALGDRVSLELPIQNITGIPVEALRGDPLSQFSVEKRMSWTQNRETRIEEDMVYSLFGFFDIHLPLMYGEGVIQALRRLGEEVEKSSSVDKQCRPSTDNLKHQIADP